MPIRVLAILGPVCFFVCSVVIAQLTSNYDYHSQMISELGASGAELAWWFNYFGFLPNGIFILLFSLCLYHRLKAAELSPLIAIMIAIHGLGMLLATWLSCDLSCTPVNPSLQQWLHNVLALIKFPALHLASLVLAWQLFKANRARYFAIWSLVSFLFSSFFVVGFGMSIEERDLTGVWQRLFLLSLYIWLVSVAVFISRENSCCSPNAESAKA